MKKGRKLTLGTETLEVHVFQSMYEEKKVKVQDVVESFLKEKGLDEDSFSLEAALKRAHRLRRKIRTILGIPKRGYNRHKPTPYNKDCEKNENKKEIAQFVLF